MSNYVVRKDLERILAGEKVVPTIVSWNRLEGRPRRKDFAQALKVEVRDPLWMITRQWQFGEFIAEDAGSPITAKIAYSTDGVSEFRAGAGGVKAYADDLPLEALVEALPLPLTLAGRAHALDVRLALGRRWRRLLEAGGHGARIPDFQNTYKFSAPDPTAAADFPITAHASTWQTIAAVAERFIDGGELLLHLVDGGLASDGLGLANPEKQQIDDLGGEFLDWATSLFYQGDEQMRSWQPRHLEYSSALTAPREGEPLVLGAPEYRGGRLDWFSFDAYPPAEVGAAGAAPTEYVTSFLPTTLQFEGMPNTRHWTFEEGATNFGAISVDTTDIAKLLLVEFGLTYANDWFLLPIDMKVGSLATIEGLSVTNVFGERFWIEPSVTAGGPVQSWSMFKLANKGAEDGRLFVPSVTSHQIESAPVESVSFVRDEVANMVWGIETVVHLPDGTSRRGREVALELHAKHQSAVVAPAGPPVVENDAKVKYVLMTSVAEHWIPFIPVHIEGDNREIQLQRAAMPRLLEGTEGLTPEPIEPRSRILREGLDREPSERYFVAEEEVERAGTVIETRWQRCRWNDGKVVLWLGHRRTAGRRQEGSGLGFDMVVPTRKRN